MPVRAALFDLDGTLLDSLGDIASCCNDALVENGFQPHPLDTYRRMVGDGAPTLVRRTLGERATDQAVEAVLHRFGTLYAQRWHRQSRLYDGIEEMLTGLQEQGIRLMVLSNKPDDFTQEIMQHYFSGWPFTWIRGARKDIPLKPHPQAALEAAAFAQLPPREMLYVGDTSTDMQTAAAAGMQALGVTWGFRDREELARHGARYIIDHPTELLTLVQNG